MRRIDDTKKTAPEVQAQKRQCSKCGELNSGEIVNFCGHCGAKLVALCDTCWIVDSLFDCSEVACPGIEGMAKIRVLFSQLQQQS